MMRSTDCYVRLKKRYNNKRQVHLHLIPPPKSAILPSTFHHPSIFITPFPISLRPLIELPPARDEL